MKILGMILSALGAFGLVFSTTILSAGDNYTEAGFIWPIWMCLWVGMTIVGIIIKSRPRKEAFSTIS